MPNIFQRRKFPPPTPPHEQQDIVDRAKALGMEPKEFVQSLAQSRAKTTGEKLVSDRTGDGILEGRITRPSLIDRALRKIRKEKRREAAEVRRILKEEGWHWRGRRK